MTMTRSTPSRSARPTFNAPKQLNTTTRHVGRDKPMAVLSGFQSIARRIAALFGLEAASRVATGRMDSESTSSAPDTFTETQARLALSLAKVKSRDPHAARKLVQAFTPSGFNRAQAICVLEMLDLAGDDFRATLADAMQPCELRDRLRREAMRNIAAVA
jgi:hypothetical protein